MKANRLQQMQEQSKALGINIPAFITINSAAELKDKCPDVNSLYAVRSSADTEDGEDVAQAGKYKTYLNVKVRDLPRRVQDVIDSYNGADGKVIIQEMIDSDYSGVIFTANPLGILNETCIVAGRGLGINVVDNKNITTTYHYNKDDKKFAVTCTSYDESEKIKLEEELLFKLIEQSERIKELFGFECDIEFAIKDKEIYILQSRPITGIRKDSISIVMDNSNIVESYPGVSLPLTQDFVKSIYYLIFKNCVGRLTNHKTDIDSTLRNMVDTVNWRFYYRIDNWYTVLQLLPFSRKIISTWQQMLGVRNKEYKRIDTGISVWTKAVITLNFIKYLIKTPKYMKIVCSRFDKNIREYRKQVFEKNTVRELTDLYTSIKHKFLKDWDITLINDMYAFIFTRLCKASKISEIKELESLKQTAALQNLIYLNRAGKEDEFKDRFDKYIDKYGDRCIGELKLETETFRQNPQKLIEYVNSGQNFGIRTKRNGRKQREGWALKRAKTGIKYRELSRLYRSQMFGLTREIFLKIGSILAEEGKLDIPTDIFYLYESEINDKNCNLKKMAAKRKLQEEKYKNYESFGRFEFNDKILHDIHYGTYVNPKNERQTVYFGEGISGGSVTGEVIVIDEPNIGTDTRDKIIVTHTTDPGWSFLIKDSLGIITEQGSLLSHTAIISRELNKPAITNISMAVKLFKDGDKIRINGETGEIERVTED